ncbi:hypothetical protein AA15669_1054 [Saccharibacter floricola DSM 15669]|uniref:Uncharacterized protein n=1 Tax=Saccharibacter floricola DSM 15669 TaxID=1123227 RepID=A0ABQ0NZH0_9PROT|nr:hypothetical protein AA15669_1054 [Saccharibacter floricola DSM 15669]
MEKISIILPKAENRVTIEGQAEETRGFFILLSFREEELLCVGKTIGSFWRQNGCLRLHPLLEFEVERNKCTAGKEDEKPHSHGKTSPAVEKYNP